MLPATLNLCPGEKGHATRYRHITRSERTGLSRCCFNSNKLKLQFTDDTRFIAEVSAGQVPPALRIVL